MTKKFRKQTNRNRFRKQTNRNRNSTEKEGKTWINLEQNSLNSQAFENLVLIDP